MKFLKTYWPTLVAFMLLINISVYSQNISLSAGFGFSKYQSKKATNENSYFGEFVAAWPFYSKMFNISTGLGLSTIEVSLKDVVILPVIDGDPVKIYNNDLRIGMKFIEIPLRFGGAINLSKNMKLNLFTGASLNFAISTKKTVKQKQLLYDGTPVNTGLKYDFSVLTEGSESQFHTIPNLQCGFDFQYKVIAIGLTYKSFLPYKKLKRLTGFSQNTNAYYLIVKYHL